jgi:hypothetical protein
MTFSHSLTCNYANFLFSMSSMLFSNPCHFLKDPFLGRYRAAWSQLTPHLTDSGISSPDATGGMKVGEQETIRFVDVSLPRLILAVRTGPTQA